MSTQKNALLLLGLPFIVALLTATLVLASETGHLSTWRPLGRPPGTVSMLTARLNSVWATLDDGTVVEARGDEEIDYDGEIHTAANLFDAMREGYYGKF